MFFVGDSAGHCLPLTAEGIRTALYFGIACGRELRAVLEGGQSREQALGRYRAFSAAHALEFEWMLRVQRLVPRVAPRLLAAGAAGDAAPSGSSTGRSTTTWRSPIPTSSGESQRPRDALGLPCRRPSCRRCRSCAA